MTWHSIGLESKLQIALFYCDGNLTSDCGWGDGFLYGDTEGDSYHTENSGIHEGRLGPAGGYGIVGGTGRGDEYHTDFDGDSF